MDINYRGKKTPTHQCSLILLLPDLISDYQNFQIFIPPQTSHFIWSLSGIRRKKSQNLTFIEKVSWPIFLTLVFVFVNSLPVFGEAEPFFKQYCSEQLLEDWVMCQHLCQVPGRTGSFWTIPLLIKQSGDILPSLSLSSAAHSARTFD